MRTTASRTPSATRSLRPMPPVHRVAFLGFVNAYLVEEERAYAAPSRPFEEAARRALEEQEPGFAYDELHLVLVDDRPGVSEDRAPAQIELIGGHLRTAVLNGRDRQARPEPAPGHVVAAEAERRHAAASRGEPVDRAALGLVLGSGARLAVAEAPPPGDVLAEHRFAEARLLPAAQAQHGKALRGALVDVEGSVPDRDEPIGYELRPGRAPRELPAGRRPTCAQ